MPQLTLRQCCEDTFAGTLHPEFYVRGVIFAVAACPEIPVPGNWFSWTFARHQQLTDEQTTDQLADCLMSELQTQLAQMRGKHAASNFLPHECGLQQAPDSPLALWLQGVLFVHQQLQCLWQMAWDKLLEKNPDKADEYASDLKHILRLLTTFADVPLALEQSANPDLANQLPEIYAGLPRALNRYVSLADELAGYLPNQFEHQSN